MNKPIPPADKPAKKPKRSPEQQLRDLAAKVATDRAYSSGRTSLDVARTHAIARDYAEAAASAEAAAAQFRSLHALQTGAATVDAQGRIVDAEPAKGET